MSQTNNSIYNLPTIEQAKIDLRHTRGPTAFNLYYDWIKIMLIEEFDGGAVNDAVLAAELHGTWRGWNPAHPIKQHFEELKEQAGEKFRMLQSSRFEKAKPVEAKKRNMTKRPRTEAEPPTKKRRCV